LLGNKLSNHKYSLNHNYNNYFNKIIHRDLVDKKIKGKDEILIEIDQRIVNQKDLSLRIKEAMLLEIIKESKDASDIDKKATLRETV